MSAALGLYRLQQVDSQIDHVQSRLSAIRQTLENDAELRAATERTAKTGDEYKKASAELRQHEAEFEKQRIKIEQAEATMYGGHVHNPKELQDLQNDVISLKKYLTILEERELESMLAVEAAEKALHEAQVDLERVQARLKIQNQDLASESDVLAKDLERLGSERNAVIGNVAQQMLNLYDQLRRQRRGIAVTMISDNACASCGTTLTAALQQNARSTTQVFHCPSCGRILFPN